MTLFDKRDQAFENKFAHDEEMAFRVIARRNKLLGIWAADKLGKNPADAEAYARDIVLAAIDHADIAVKVLDDLKRNGLQIRLEEVRAEMQLLLPIARGQIIGGE